METKDYWVNAKARILADIQDLNNIIMLTNGLWMGTQDETFKALLMESNRVNGALHGYFTRQLLECDYFRDYPPPPTNELRKHS